MATKSSKKSVSSSSTSTTKESSMSDQLNSHIQDSISIISKSTAWNQITKDTPWFNRNIAPRLAETYWRKCLRKQAKKVPFIRELRQMHKYILRSLFQACRDAICSVKSNNRVMYNLTVAPQLALKHMNRASTKYQLGRKCWYDYFMAIKYWLRATFQMLVLNNNFMIISQA